MLVLAFVVSGRCQQSEIELTQDEAIAIATEQVDFEPENTQIRLLRQGLDRHPFWIVSLSIPRAPTDSVHALAMVRIDATSGEVVEFNQQATSGAADAGDGAGEEGRPRRRCASSSSSTSPASTRACSRR